MENLKNKIKKLAETYSSTLKEKIDERKEAMKSDDNAHYLILEFWELHQKRANV